MEEKHKWFNKRTLCIILSIGIIIGIIICVGIEVNNKQQPTEYSTGTVEEVKTDNNYAKNKKINPDYIGTLKFASGLIEEAVVQGEDSDTYLRTNWQTGEYDEEGSVFMDSENKLTDQNITIYGHYVYKEYESSGTHKFTPLEQLLKEANYEDNKIISLYLDGETRQYQIVAVYLCDLTEELVTPSDLQYYTTNWTKEGFEAYKSAVKENQLYETGVDFSYSDKFLTLQTCVENKPYQREIVLAKEIKLSR